MSNAQKRHWCVTIYAGHIGLDDDYSDEELIDSMKLHWETVRYSPNLSYAVGQIERCPTTGRLHIQAYTEWKRSLRMSEVYKVCPGNLDYRKGTREDARDYCRKAQWKGKDKGQVMKLLEFGKWRASKSSGVSPKQRALEMIRLGMSPAEILQRDFEVYFTHYRAIEACYNLMEKAGISISTSGEEE